MEANQGMACPLVRLQDASRSWSGYACGADLLEVSDYSRHQRSTLCGGGALVGLVARQDTL